MEHWGYCTKENKCGFCKGLETSKWYYYGINYCYREDSPYAYR